MRVFMIRVQVSSTLTNLIAISEFHFKPNNSASMKSFHKLEGNGCQKMSAPAFSMATQASGSWN
ncbi:MAG TPA: hypothetical protein DD706_03485 [Nitrospiraceae bacterium]|nr:hypothetical protein [Nitrospiraceae bacterium]